MNEKKQQHAVKHLEEQQKERLVCYWSVWGGWMGFRTLHDNINLYLFIYI